MWCLIVSIPDLCPLSYFENHVHNCLSDFLHNFELLQKTKSGFRAVYSCEIALLHMIEFWLHAFDNGQMIGVVLVD